jgi:phage shock protein A
MSGLSDTSAFEAFNRMAEKIEESERRTLAAAEVTEALSGDTLETEFLKLEAGGADPDVENRLLALKQQMGLIAGSAETPKQLGAGDEGEEEGGQAEAAGRTVDADVEAVEEDDEAKGKGDAVAEADLIEQFRSLEKNAEA